MLTRLEQMLPGSIVFPQDFTGDGNQGTIRQNLTEISKAGRLIRLSQGMYLLPRQLGSHGLLMPSPEEIATALARRDKAKIIPTGEVSLWKLGLTTQVPLNYVYLTDGPSHVVKISDSVNKKSYNIKFKHASPKNFALRGKISSQVIQALKVIGESALTPDIRDKITSLIMKENIEDINHDIAIAPAWIARLIKDSFNIYKA